MSEPNELTTTEAAARLDHLNVVELRNAIRRGEVEAEKRKPTVLHPRCRGRAPGGRARQTYAK